jgi:hypothetical protein
LFCLSLALSASCNHRALLALCGKTTAQITPYASSSGALSAYENQNAGRECQKPSHYYRDSDCVDERTDSDEDQVDCQQEHS